MKQFNQVSQSVVLHVRSSSLRLFRGPPLFLFFSLHSVYNTTSWKRKSSKKRVSPLFCFHVLYTDYKLKNKIRGGLGTRLGLLHLYFFNDRKSAVPSTVLWFSTHFQRIKKYLVAFLGDIAGILTNMI